MNPPRRFRLTWVETLTALVALVVIAAVAIPMYRTHQLRERRDDARQALRDIQAAQDRHFGSQARYALAKELELSDTSPKGYYALAIERAQDQLSYVAVARAIDNPERKPDLRCAVMRRDQNGRTSAMDIDGKDTSADCWAER